MRPARKGPENPVPRPGIDAGRVLRFNEAGPQGAGKPAAAAERRVADHHASMRPARKGPENPILNGPASDASYRFNEAGPQGAGKPPLASQPRRQGRRLQ